MKREALLELLEASPVIAAVKSPAGLAQCLACGEVRVVFILYGDLLTLGATVAKIRETGRVAVVHVDLIDGLSAREIAVDFVANTMGAEGIISTKPLLIRRARHCGLLTVQRFFLLDSIALAGMQKQLGEDSGDFIEVLPGVMPKIVRRLAASTERPIIAGGLISDKEDVLAALGAGAVAVSTTNEHVWTL